MAVPAYRCFVCCFKSVNIGKDIVFALVCHYIVLRCSCIIIKSQSVKNLTTVNDNCDRGMSSNGVEMVSEKVGGIFVCERLLTV